MGLREVFNGLRYIVKSGAPWRWMPNDAGVLQALVDDRRAILRVADGRAPDPRAAVFDSRTLRATPASGARAGDDGAKRKTGSKVHMAVGTLGHLLTLPVTPAIEQQDRAPVEALARAVQAVTDQAVELAWGDQGDTGEEVASELPPAE